MLSKYRALLGRLPAQMGAIAVAFVKNNFVQQGFKNHGSVTPWQKRSGNRDEGRAILMKTRNLSRNVKVKQVGPAKVIVGVDASIKYAQIQNEGGQIPITLKMRRFFWAMYYKSQDEFWKNLALTKKTTLTIPKRQFIGDSTDLRDQIGKFIEKEVEKALKK